MLLNAAMLAGLLASVSVTVFDTSGAVLPGVAVELLQDGIRRERGLTDDVGLVAFDPVRPGVYVVRTTLDGFEVNEARIEVGPRTSGNIEVTLVVDDLFWYFKLLQQPPDPFESPCLIWETQRPLSSSELEKAP